MRLSKGLLHCAARVGDIVAGQNRLPRRWRSDQQWQMNEPFWCQELNGTKQRASVTSWLLQHSPYLIIIIIITSAHSNHPRDRRRKNRRSNRSLAPVPSSPPWISGADCGEMNKLTWLFWARRQRQTRQWSRGEWQTTKTPQRPSRSLFFSRFPHSWTEIWMAFCRNQ